MAPSLLSSLVPRDHAVLQLPPGVVPNYVNPVSNGDYYIIPVVITLALAFIAVALRLLNTVFVAEKWFGAQDYLYVVALLFAIARATCYIIDIKNFDMGHHIWDIQMPFSDYVWRLATIGNTMYPLGILCAKIAIVLFYLQIFGHHKPFRWACFLLIGVDSIYLSVYFLMSIFWCRPLIAAWSLSAMGTNPYVCINGYDVDLAVGALNLVTDIAILILPMTMVWKLQLSPTRKLGVAAVFAIGIFAIVTVILREVIVSEKLTTDNPDQTWNVVYEATWLSVELHVAIICGAVLTIPQLMRHIITKTAIGAPFRSWVQASRASKGSGKNYSSGAGFKFSSNSYERQGSQDGSLVNHDIELGNHSAMSTITAERDFTFEGGREGGIHQTKTFTTRSEGGNGIAR